MATQLDSLDFKILVMLSENARRPYLEIARECGVSGAAVHQRVQKLYSMGVIREAITVINPASLGFDTCAYIGLMLKEPSKSERIIEAIRKIPEVVECYYTTGQYDVFIKIYARNNEDLLRLIHNSLSNLSDTRSETLICFKEVFKRQIPVVKSAD